MSAAASIRRSREHGFGLIEILITLVVMAAVLGMVFSALHRSQHQTNRLTNVAEERQMARAAVQLIERETRMAGSGWGRTVVEGSNNGVPWALYAVTMGYGGPAHSDSVTILGAWQASTTINAAMPTSSSIIDVASVDGFAPGDLVIITDPDNKSAHLFECTAINTSTNHIQHNPSSPYNEPGGHNGWPSSGYPTGSFVYKVTMSTYWYDSTAYRKPVLMRREAGKAAQIVAYNVDGFHVWYELQDGTWTRDPGTLTFVDKVIPVVLTRVTDSRLPTLRDSVWAAVRPRTF